MTDNERRVAASHILRIMGAGSLVARRLAESVLAEPTWADSPPLVGGLYWHWNGDEDSAPIPLNVSKSGFSGKCFVMRGQYCIDDAIDCDVYGGFWKLLPNPSLPETV